MAVGFVASASSGSQASVASFTISASLGTGARAGIVFVAVHNSSTDLVTGVTWNGVAMTRLYRATDTDTEPGSVVAYFLDNVSNGSVVVSRTNNATVTVGYAASISAGGATEVAQTITRVSSTQNTNADTSTTGTGASGEVAVDDGSLSGTNSMRFAAAYSGAATPPAAGTNSTALQVLDSTALGSRFVRETTAGTGSRNVGFATGTTDDWALVAVAVREKVRTITVPLLDASPALYAPTIIPDQFITLPLLQTTAVTYGGTILADSPRGYWRLGEPSGTAADNLGSGGSAIDGTYVGTPTLGVAGALTRDTDTAVTFNGSSQYVTAPDDNSLDLADTFSIEFWMKRAAISTNMVVIQKGTGTSSGYQVWINSSNSINLADGAGNNVAYINTAVSDTTTWHHVVFTKSGSTRVAYLDGKADTGLGTNATLTDNTSGLSIASMNGGGNYFNGSLDEVALYATALTAAQVNAHYAAAFGEYASALFADSPVLVVPMGEASGNLRDIVAGKTGTASGTPTYGATGPVQGYTAIDIPSGSDFFTVADHADIDLNGTDFSIEFWYARDTDSATWQGILSKQNAWGASVDPDDMICLTIPGVTSPFRATSPVPTDSTWHHYVITRINGASVPADCAIYVDGVAATISVYNYTAISATATDLVIGNDTGTYPAGGKIAYLAVYKSILSASQVAAHYAARTDSPGGATLFAPVVERLSGGTTQTLTIPLLDASAALYAPSVLPQPVGITIGLLESTPALYAPTLVPKNTLTLGLLDAASALYQPTLTRYNTITLGLLTSTSALYQPTVTPKNTLTLGLLESTPTLYEPTLAVGPVTIQLGLLDAGATLYAPTVAPVGGVTQDIVLGLLDAGPALYQPTVAPTYTLTPPLLDAGSALYQPTLTPKNTLTIPLLTSTSALYQPTLTLAPYPITVPLLDAGAALYQPTLTQVGGTFQTITLGQLDAGPTLFAPTIIPGAVAIIVPLLDSGAALFAPSVLQGQAITLGLLDGSAALYAPTLYAYSPIVLPLLDGAGELYPPTLLNTAVFITGITRDSNGTPLGSVEVHVFRTSDDVEVAQVTSNALGVFSIQVQAGIAHYIVAYKTGTPDRAGTTLNTLVGS